MPQAVRVFANTVYLSAFMVSSADAGLLQGGRGCAAPADVRRVLPAVSPRRGRVPSPHVMDAAGGRAPARALGRGCCLAPAYSSAPGCLADDQVRFPPTMYVGSSPLKIIVPLARGFGAPGSFRESILAGFPVRGCGRDPR